MLMLSCYSTGCTPGRRDVISYSLQVYIRGSNYCCLQDSLDHMMLLVQLKLAYTQQTLEDVSESTVLQYDY